MNKYYSSSLFVFILTIWLPLHAQTSFANPYKFPSEVGIMTGASNYAGDIVKKGDYDLSASCLSFSAFYRTYSSTNLSWRFSLTQGKLRGNDNSWANTDRIGRGFSFSNPLTELAARAEYDLLNHQRWSLSEGFRKKFSLYGFIGAGVSLINNNTTFNRTLGARYDQLISEDEENQRSVMFTVPFGGGIKLDLSERWILGAELALNPVFNDYLDGISISANPKFNDWYSVGGVTLTYRLQSVFEHRFFIKEKKKESLEGDSSTQK